MSQPQGRQLLLLPLFGNFPDESVAAKRFMVLCRPIDRERILVAFGWWKRPFEGPSVEADETFVSGNRKKQPGAGSRKGAGRRT